LNALTKGLPISIEGDFSRPTPEQILWAAVVWQGLKDLENEDSKIRKSAWNFFYCNLPAFREHRAWVLFAAGLDMWRFPKTMR
jgi:hypothetical protein